jgi:hypothetical protein
VTAQAESAKAKGYDHVRVFAQDESRLGLLPIVRHRITARGVQPIQPTSFRFESFYLYGAVEPITGDRFFLELPQLNTACFQIFADEFSKAFPDSFNILLMDNGAFHKAKALRLADNVVGLFFPAYSPELNPIERLWRDLKDRLARHSATSLDELSDLVAQFLNRYGSDDIRSLTGYDYFVKAVASINGYLS